METKLVTVLMPVRDTPSSMLDVAIASVLRQTYADFQFLIVDDGSRVEETLASLDRASSDRRVRILTTGGLGVTRALNTGLRAARGKFIARQDADDWSEPDRIARQMEFFNSHAGVILCGTAAWRHRADGSRLWRAHMPETHPEIRKALENGNPFFHGSVMFSREKALGIGAYREEFSCAQDYDFFWRMTEAGKAANLGAALYHYRYTAQSVSAQRASEQIRSHGAAQRLAWARERGEVEDVRGALAASCPDWVAAALREADHCLLAGNARGAWHGYWGVLSKNPGAPMAWSKMARWAVFASLPGARQFIFERGRARCA